VTGTLFPHLSARSRRPFAAALALYLLTLLVLTMLRWQAPLITVAAVGLTVVFAVYLVEAGVSRTIPVRDLMLVATLAAGLGVAWVLATGAMVADTYDVALGDDGIDGRKVLVGIGVPVGSAMLMLAAPFVPQLRLRTREPLDGFALGALSALVFTAAATLTRLGPQYRTGVTAQGQSPAVLLVQAAIQGVALPLTAAALGGWVGAALWRRRPWRIVASIVVSLSSFALMGLAEVLPVRHTVHLALHVLIGVIAVLALRVELRSVPRPEPTDRERGHARVLTAFGACIGLAAVAGLAAALLATPHVARIVCPPDCGRPPIGEPIESNPRFYADGGAFSVQYPGPGSAYEATFESDGVELQFTGGDTGTLRLFGISAQNRTPKQIADALIDEHYPDAITDYEVPNAMVGYQPGYGIVADDYPQDANGTFARLRLIVMVAVRNDYALVASAVGPYHEFSRDFGTGHPSGANLQLAIDMGKYVNSFRWGEVTD
jgi:hypothetical protein